MDKKIHIKQNKRDGKYTMDYSKVQHRNTVRFDLLRQIGRASCRERV